MAVMRKPDSKAEKAADKKKGIKPGSAADKKQDSLPPWLRKGAPAKGTKGGKAPKSSNPFGKK